MAGENEVTEKKELTALESKSIEIVTEVVKQLIWICSGFTIFTLTSLLPIKSIFLDYLWFLSFPSLTSLVFLASIFYCIKFLLAITARSAFHGDVNILSDVPKKDMKRAFFFFRTGIIVFSMSFILFIFLNCLPVKNNQENYIEVHTPTTKLNIFKDSLNIKTSQDTISIRNFKGPILLNLKDTLKNK